MILGSSHRRAGPTGGAFSPQPYRTTQGVPSGLPSVYRQGWRSVRAGRRMPADLGVSTSSMTRAHSSHLEVTGVRSCPRRRPEVVDDPRSPYEHVERVRSSPAHGRREAADKVGRRQGPGSPELSRAPRSPDHAGRSISPRVARAWCSQSRQAGAPAWTPVQEAV